MSKTYNLTTPLTTADLEPLHVGDKVMLNGIIYTARDAAHKRLVALLQENQPLPFDIRGAVIYYVGPSPARPGKPIGSAGPTTSYRMDKYSPLLMDAGLKGMIGKGERNRAVIDAIIKNKAVYFASIGGTAVVAAQAVKSARVIAYEDLGAEALTELVVANFPVFVANDIYGNDIFEQGVAQYRKE